MNISKSKKESLILPNRNAKAHILKSAHFLNVSFVENRSTDFTWGSNREFPIGNSNSFRNASYKITIMKSTLSVSTNTAINVPKRLKNRINLLSMNVSFPSANWHRFNRPKNRIKSFSLNGKEICNSSNKIPVKYKTKFIIYFHWGSTKAMKKSKQL